MWFFNKKRKIKKRIKTLRKRVFFSNYFF
jgi:hypothetical protein